MKVSLIVHGITRESSRKILGDAFSNIKSSLDHIRHVPSESAQTLYALLVRRTTGSLLVSCTL